MSSSSPNNIPIDGTSSSQKTSSASSSSSSSNTSSYQAPNIFNSIMSRPPNSPLSSAHYTAEAALHRPIALYGSGGVTNCPAGSLTDINNLKEEEVDGTSTRTKEQQQIDLSRVALTMRALPYPQPWTRTNATPSDLPPNFDWLSESCGSKAAIGVIGGGVMGLVMGVFMGALTDMTPPVTIIEGKEVPQAPLKEQMRTTLRATADKSMYWCRQFAFITGVFGGSECLVEKYRGKHDVWNAVFSGCITGAAMQAKQGPQASAIGCGGFAAFSLVIDSVMGTHS